jgi:electron transfer flavoprotein alpha subunit
VATSTCWWPAQRQAAADAAAQIAGVAKVLHADAAHFADGLAENVAAQVLAIAKATATSWPRHRLRQERPRVAAKLDVAQISDITKVESADTFERPIYAGNAIATVQSSTRSRSSPCAPPASTGRTGGSAAVEARPWPIRASPASSAVKSPSRTVPS